MILFITTVEPCLLLSETMKACKTPGIHPHIVSSMLIIIDVPEPPFIATATGGRKIENKNFIVEMFDLIKLAEVHDFKITQLSNIYNAMLMHDNPRHYLRFNPSIK